MTDTEHGGGALTGFYRPHRWWHLAPPSWLTLLYEPPRTHHNGHGRLPARRP